jgi:leucyl/phenylalanyl-tRNA---protein transferase
VSGQPPSRFPDPRTGPGDAPLAVGGDLEPETMLDAYRHGIFPWPDGNILFWWSPDPRALLPLDGLHISRSLRRILHQDRFDATVDQAFSDVVRSCANRAGEGTWIVPDLIHAYERLHDQGHAHSVEVWHEGRLAGGIFGITVGAVFTGESMFHRVTDASKVALVRLVERLRAGGFALFDVQLPTPHLTSLGAVEVARADFLDLLAQSVVEPATLS